MIVGKYASKSISEVCNLIDNQGLITKITDSFSALLPKTSSSLKPTSSTTLSQFSHNVTSFSPVGIEQANNGNEFNNYVNRYV
jgi:hypothetical protein